ncbi:hypothetical protein BCR39DRAFT_521571 [Naematelia encephala]|uniref:Uncharacterized protein n=1 Tax=Naematelia encephala TaxID=71784 RepID=A0A1Y2BD71_9TREE|nr:hypothetical protein BCR39DRAFT_521571 [Naematelia encephala]
MQGDIHQHHHHQQQQQQSQPQYDPALLELSKSSINTTSNPSAHHDPIGIGVGVGEYVAIDPALFEIEDVVNDVRRGKIRLDEVQVQVDDEHPQEQGQGHGHGHGTGGGGGGNEGMTLDDEEIDPALREIVNSLTNAQQAGHPGPGLTHAQAAAAIGAHLAESDERERLQQSFQTTLDDLARDDFGGLFAPNFPHSPTSTNYLLPPAEGDPLAGPSSPHIPLHEQLSDTPHADTLDSSSLLNPKRGRGRPKGSKNKPKARPPPPPPRKPTPPPPKPRGRPPKVRTSAEQAEYERRKHEMALGIKRRKGRPRKFPGYLVREMRLSKNRSEFNELLRAYEEGRFPRPSGEDQEADGEGVDDEADGGGNGNGDGDGGEYDTWDYSQVGVDVADGQTLLDVVGVAQQQEAHVVDEEPGPSGLDRSDAGMRAMFGLDA